MSGKLLKLQKNKNSFMYNWEMKVDLFIFFINEYEKRYGKEQETAIYEIEDEGDDFLIYSLLAKELPTKYFKNISANYPTLKFSLSYAKIDEYCGLYQWQNGKVVKNVSSDNEIPVNYLFYTGDIKGMIDDEVIDMNDLDENEILENINELLTIHNTIKKNPIWHKCFYIESDETFVEERLVIINECLEIKK